MKNLIREAKFVASIVFTLTAGSCAQTHQYGFTRNVLVKGDAATIRDCVFAKLKTQYISLGPGAESFVKANIFDERTGAYFMHIISRPDGWHDISKSWDINFHNGSGAIGVDIDVHSTFNTDNKFGDQIGKFVSDCSSPKGP